MNAPDLSRIETKIVIRAPRARVWRAITDIAEFSRWFSVEAEGAFAPGARLRMTSTHESAKGQVFYVDIQEMTPERSFSWRWHPGVAKPGEDRSKEPATLVVFQLDEVPGGTMVTVTESGFEQLSLTRRARVFEENRGGWKIQMASLERYAGGAS